RLPGQPRLLPQHRGLAGPGRRPHLHPAQGARGPAPDAHARAAPERDGPRSPPRPGPVRRDGDPRVVGAAMKRSPFWKTYAALAVAIGLGAYIYFVESRRPDTGAGKPKEKVFTLDRAKVKSLTLVPAGADQVRLVKEKDGWRMTAPLDVAADAGEVDSILSSLESVQAEEVVSEN